MKNTILFSAFFLLFTSFSDKQLTWVALGDSITYLNDHANETGNRITKGYMTRVIEKRSDIQFINQGHNGWTAVRIADSIDRLGLVKADIYTVFLGTNDWWRGEKLGMLTDYKNGTGSSTVYGAFRVIINKLRSLNEQAKIVLITPMQRSDFVYINNPANNAYGSYKQKAGQNLEDFARAVDSIARFEALDVVDLYHEKSLGLKKLVKFKRLKDTATGTYKNVSYPHYIGLPYDPQKDEYPYPAEAIDMTYDGLHPSDKGYEIITNMLMRVFKKY